MFIIHGGCARQSNQSSRDIQWRQPHPVTLLTHRKQSLQDTKHSGAGSHARVLPRVSQTRTYSAPNTKRKTKKMTLSSKKHENRTLEFMFKNSHMEIKNICSPDCCSASINGSASLETVNYNIGICLHKTVCWSILLFVSTDCLQKLLLSCLWQCPNLPRGTASPDREQSTELALPCQPAGRNPIMQHD